MLTQRRLLPQGRGGLAPHHNSMSRAQFLAALQTYHHYQPPTPAHLRPPSAAAAAGLTSADTTQAPVTSEAGELLRPAPLTDEYSYYGSGGLRRGRQSGDFRLPPVAMATVKATRGSARRSRARGWRKLPRVEPRVLQPRAAWYHPDGAINLQALKHLGQIQGRHAADYSRRHRPTPAPSRPALDSSGDNRTNNENGPVPPQFLDDDGQPILLLEDEPRREEEREVCLTSRLEAEVMSDDELEDLAFYVASSDLSTDSDEELASAQLRAVMPASQSRRPKSGKAPTARHRLVAEKQNSDPRSANPKSVRFLPSGESENHSYAETASEPNTQLSSSSSRGHDQSRRSDPFHRVIMCGDEASDDDDEVAYFSIPEEPRELCASPETTHEPPVQFYDDGGEEIDEELTAELRSWLINEKTKASHDMRERCEQDSRSSRCTTQTDLRSPFNPSAEHPPKATTLLSESLKSESEYDDDLSIAETLSVDAESISNSTSTLPDASSTISLEAVDDVSDTSPTSSASVEEKEKPPKVGLVEADIHAPAQARIDPVDKSIESSLVFAPRDASSPSHWNGQKEGRQPSFSDQPMCKEQQTPRNTHKKSRHRKATKRGKRHAKRPSVHPDSSSTGEDELERNSARRDHHQQRSTTRRKDRTSKTSAPNAEVLHNDSSVVDVSDANLNSENRKSSRIHNSSDTIAHEKDSNTKQPESGRAEAQHGDLGISTSDSPAQPKEDAPTPAALPLVPVLSLTRGLLMLLPSRSPGVAGGESSRQTLTTRSADAPVEVDEAKPRGKQVSPGTGFPETERLRKDDRKKVWLTRTAWGRTVDCFEHKG